MTDPQVVSVGGGTVGVFSARSPLKESANEDAAAIIPAGDDSVVLVVADGVGGKSSGEQASRIAVECLEAAVAELRALEAASGVMIVAEPPPAVSPRNNGSSNLRTAILNGLEQANRQILALGTGAATTIAVVEVSGRTIRPYHVGDSMILLTGGLGKVKVQTIPHSPVGYGIESGLLNDEEAMHHEDRHLVSNVIGCPDMRIEIGPTRTLAPRDTLLLASDGLSDNLHLDEIVESVRKGPLKKSLKKLTGAASQRMQHAVDGQPSKPDDLTCIVYRLAKPKRKRTKTRQPVTVASNSR